MPSHEQISRLAYQLWELDSYVQGKDQQHWFAAEDMLRRSVPIAEAIATGTVVQPTVLDYRTLRIERVVSDFLRDVCATPRCDNDIAVAYVKR